MTAPSPSDLRTAAQTHLRAGRIEQACAAYRALVEAEPNAPDLRYGLGAALSAAGDEAGAADAWSTARVFHGLALLRELGIDMDRFAAQISALDAVVSISNTGAHLTGALGIPMIVINGDNLRRAWPVTTDRIPWYPNTVIVGKRNRPWHLVMSEVRDRLSDMLVKRR